MATASNANTHTLTFTTKSDTTYINFRLGVSNSGTSITYSNVQLFEGSLATEYVTSSTTVTNPNNHTLHAQWKDIEAPTFRLEALTYHDGFVGSGLRNATISSDGTIITLDDGASGESYIDTPQYRANGEYWWYDVEAYADTTASHHSPRGGVFGSMVYHDITGLNAQTNDAGYSANGWTNALELNTWSTVGVGAYALGSTRVNIVNTHNETYASTGQIKYRNPKFYANNAPYKWYYVRVLDLADNASDIVALKFISGEKTAAECMASGSTITAGQLKRVVSNGIYTVCAKDAANNISVQAINVTKIISKPSPTYGNSTPTSISNLYYTFDGYDYMTAPIQAGGSGNLNLNWAANTLLGWPYHVYKGEHAGPYHLYYYGDDITALSPNNNHSTTVSYMSGFHRISAGSNALSLRDGLNGIGESSGILRGYWYKIIFHGGYNTPNSVISNLKISQTRSPGSNALTLQQAASNGQIEPLILYLNGAADSGTINNVVTGGSFGGAWGTYIIYIKLVIY